MSSGEAEASKDVVRIFYEDLWNRLRLEVADEIVSTNFRFRTSLGCVITGREELKRYVETVRAAFPDFNHVTDEMLAIDDRVVTSVTYSGTHLGKLRDVEPTGARVEYVGAAFFRLSSGMIHEAWGVADTRELWRALGRL
jgi:predicted ester cyclase